MSPAVDALQGWEAEHGTAPTIREWKAAKAQPSRYFIEREFGSWASALRAAGLRALRPGESKPVDPRIGAPDRLPLTSTEGIVGWVRLDPADRRRLAGRHWNLGTDGYAYGQADGRRVAMHRLLLGLRKGDGLDCDHWNGDRLDNRRSNLRVATRAQNLQNQTTPARGRSRFRGFFLRHGRRWVARASLNNLNVCIGAFDAELDAAIAAQRWRDEHMPFAQPDPELVATLGAWPPVEAAA